MNFIKLQAEKIFDGYRFREKKVLILQTGGTVEAIVNTDEAGDDIQKIEGVLSPGFINCHCHLELSHLKNSIVENTGLLQFVQQIVQKRKASEETVLQAIADAENEMIQNGIVAVGDICNGRDTIAQKKKGNLYYHNFVEAMGSDAKMSDRNFEIFKTVYDLFCDNFDTALVSLVPHAPYSMSKPLLQKVIHLPQNNLLSIHNQETQEENLWFQKKEGGFRQMFEAMCIDQYAFQPSGTTSLQTYLNTFLPHQSVILVHNVHTSGEDLQYSKNLSTKLFWCFCANANQYISNTLPDIPLFIKNDCAMVLGTDSLASNHQLSIWEEIRTIQNKFPEIELEQVLRWATINGAKALHVENQYGSFEKGKTPGLVQIRDFEAKKYFYKK